MTDQLNISTININGLRAPRKQLYLKEYISKHKIDILCVQETHIENFLLSKNIERNFNLEKRVYWSYGSNNSRGVCTIICNPNINVIKFQTDFDGRLVYVDFNLSNSSNITYRLINLYSPTESSERNIFLNSIIPHLVVAKN